MHPRIKILLQMLSIIGICFFGFTACSEHYQLGVNAYNDTARSCMSERFYIVRKEKPDSLNEGVIVTFDMPDELRDVFTPEKFPEHPTFLKIVRATAGDHIQVTEDAVILNGQVVGSRPLIPDLLAHDYPHYAKTFDVVLKEGEVFVMGENDASFDSRYWGPLDASRIKGEVIYRFL